MEYKKRKIKEGMNFHIIKTNRFKTNMVACFLTVPLKKENVTLNSVLAAVLRRGTQNMKTQEEISKNLENMYGATFDCGVEKLGDNEIIKFYIEALNNDYLLDNENLIKEQIEKLLDIVFNPLIENGHFNEEYVKAEKENVKQLIEAKIDDKNQYAIDRCIEEMYKDKPYGVYKYGYLEDLENITKENLYEYYKNLIQNCKIDIFVSGNVEEEPIYKIIEENLEIKKLQERNPELIINNETTEIKEEMQEKNIEESLDISQGKLVIGLDIKEYEKDSRFIAVLYSTILGGGANSKLFQNVREKASLAYSAGSLYLKQKNNVFIRAGIEIKNYEKALEIIKKQLEDIKNGEFSEEDVENAKRYLIYTMWAIEEEQDTGIIYYLGQELAKTNITTDEYIKKINAVNKEQIKKIANKISINTIYFLKN